MCVLSHDINDKLSQLNPFFRIVSTFDISFTEINLANDEELKFILKFFKTKKEKNSTTISLLYKNVTQENKNRSMNSQHSIIMSLLSSYLYFSLSEEDLTDC